MCVCNVCVQQNNSASVKTRQIGKLKAQIADLSKRAILTETTTTTASSSTTTTLNSTDQQHSSSEASFLSRKLPENVEILQQELLVLRALLDEQKEDEDRRKMQVQVLKDEIQRLQAK